MSTTMECLRYLDGVCNGADGTDNEGFNKFDAPRLKSMARYHTLTDKQLAFALDRMQKYRKQLEAAGLELPYPAKKEEEITVVEMEEEESEHPDEQPEIQEAGQEDITLSDEQRSLFSVMEETRQHLFVTGRAGTGKSVLLRYFREHTKKRTVVVAPTGIAALNVRGQTIHSLFRIPPQFIRPGSLNPNKQVASLLKRLETIIIDEVSMVRADLMDAIDERLRQARNSDEPFGGVQIIAFGDLYQLPPVVDEGLIQYFEAVHGGYYFFHAHVWKATRFEIYELSEIFRQKDPIFKDILNAVREGTISDAQIEQLNERSQAGIPDSGVITLAATNALVSQINGERLAKLAGEERKYKAMITGNLEKSSFPTEEELQLKVGAQIILLKNDKDGRWVNGTIATVHTFTEDGIEVYVDGIAYEVEQTTWEKIVYSYNPATGSIEEEVVSSFTQFPLRLAWAMTIHKSQGQTYQSVILDMTHDAFAPGQLYVALSRCTSLEGLYLKMPLKRSSILVEPKVAAFMKSKGEITPPALQQALFEAPPLPAKSKLVEIRIQLTPEQLKRAKGQDLSQLVEKLLDDHFSIDF